MGLENIDFTKAPRKPPSCQECGRKTRIGLSDSAYPDEPHLHGEPIWLCDCGAFGRCFSGTIIPAVRPGNAQTRAMRHAIYTALRTGSKIERREKYRRFGHLDLGWCPAKILKDYFERIITE